MENPFYVESTKVCQSKSLESLIKLCMQTLPKQYINEDENTTRFRLALKINQISNPSFTENLASMVLNQGEQEWCFVYRDVQCLINCANYLGANIPQPLQYPITTKTSCKVLQPYVVFYYDIGEFRIIE
jgi:hypothetical protein